MEKVNQHYVPQFYLRNFSPNCKSIGMYINRTKKCILDAAIKEQASKKYLYGEDLKIENFFTELEGKASSIISKMFDEVGFSKDIEDNMDLLQFLLLLEARTLKIADSSIHSSNFINNILEKPQDESKGCIPNLNAILVATESMPIIADLTMALITCSSDCKFITSDTPVCRYNLLYILRNYAMRGYGLANIGAQFFLPLSSRHCLYLFDQDAYVITGDISDIKKTDVDELNRLFLLNSYQYLFFDQSNGMDYVVNLARSANHSNEIRDEIERFGSLIIRKPNKVTDKVNLSFIKVKKETYEMPFPAHMGGPVRPIAQKMIDEIDLNRNENRK